MRTHPPTLITLVRGALVRECGVKKGDHVLLAVSGGVDSTALLHVLAGLRARVGFTLSAHGVDHGLRAEAAAELAHAAALAARLEVPWADTRVRVSAGGNVQARARDARYEALEAARTACGANVLATAHHADDRAETVMMRLLRGTGPDGLGVLAPRDGARIRPMIRATRADVSAHVRRHALAPAHDPSNRDPRYLRTRVRGELMPLLAALNPGAAAHLCALADHIVRQKSERLQGDAPPRTRGATRPTRVSNDA